MWRICRRLYLGNPCSHPTSNVASRLRSFIRQQELWRWWPKADICSQTHFSHRLQRPEYVLHIVYVYLLDEPHNPPAGLWNLWRRSQQRSTVPIITNVTARGVAKLNATSLYILSTFILSTFSSFVSSHIKGFFFVFFLPDHELILQ